MYFKNYIIPSPAKDGNNGAAPLLTHKSLQGQGSNIDHATKHRRVHKIRTRFNKRAYPCILIQIDKSRVLENFRKWCLGRISREQTKWRTLCQYIAGNRQNLRGNASSGTVNFVPKTVCMNTLGHIPKTWVLIRVTFIQ